MVYKGCLYRWSSVDSYLFNWRTDSVLQILPVVLYFTKVKQSISINQFAQ